MKLPQESVRLAIDDLVGKIHKLVERPQGRYRSEDLISAVCAFTGECVMRQAGDFDFDNHDFTPGQAIFSEKVNEILSGDRSEWVDIPTSSVFGGVRHVLANQRTWTYPLESFPNIGKIYQDFASERRNGVSKGKWGKAPLSVPAANLPVEHMPPLRAAFKLRSAVAQKWLNENVSAQIMTVIGQAAVMLILTRTRESIQPKIALAIAFETLNAIAKTAPMLPKHIDMLVKRAIN